MSGKKSKRNWTAVLVILILVSLAVALWPIISGQQVDQATPIEINVPVTVADTGVLALTGLQAVGILTGLIVVMVVGVGILIMAINTFLARQVKVVTESQEYQTRLAAFIQKENDQIGAARSARTTKPVPEHNMPRWSAVSTSLIILLFAVFSGMFVDGVLVPSGTYMIGDTLVNSAVPIVGGFVLIAVVVILWRIRPNRLESVKETDNGPIPWDFIWVLVSGLLVVGLGLGLVVYLNAG